MPDGIWVVWGLFCIPTDSYASQSSCLFCQSVTFLTALWSMDTIDSKNAAWSLLHVLFLFFFFFFPTLVLTESCFESEDEDTNIEYLPQKLMLIGWISLTHLFWQTVPVFSEYYLVVQAYLRSVNLEKLSFLHSHNWLQSPSFIQW